MGVKKVNAKHAPPEEAAAFFSFVYENALKYAYKILGIEAEIIRPQGRGIKKVEYVVERVKGLPLEKAAASLFFSFKEEIASSKSKNAFAPFPTQAMLIKAYPHLKVRRR